MKGCINNMGKKRVIIERLNWDVEFCNDILNGNGFIISEPATISLDDSKKKTLYGAHSPLYGTSYEDEHSFVERYRCRCGEFKSRLFEGEICPICNTPVEYRDSDINITGWITLAEHRAINPYYYRVLSQAIGKSIFPDIVTSRIKVDTDGHTSIPKREELDYVPLSEYSGIGIEMFYEKYTEILEHFKTVKKNKVKTFDILLNEKHKVFTSHIPIYSTMLRPQSVTADTFYFGGIDKEINPLFTLSEQVKTCTELERHFILGRIQARMNSMWDIIFEDLNGKDGLIRDQLLGGSLNNTSRNVIIPDHTLHDNEVDMSYNTFLELFKFKIIHYLMKMDGIKLSKAYHKWKMAFKFDKRIYEIMLFILENDKPKLLINRNPTLNYYSMLLMGIRTIKMDKYDFTLSVPLSILPGLNADFDGDILNIIALMNEEIIHMFRKFDPVSRMIISRDNGGLNPYFAITKSQLIDLYRFATI